LSSSSETESQGRQQSKIGKSFEDSVGRALSDLFEKVEFNKPVDGFSGIKWRVDFLVDSRFIVEATTQKRLETKITSTFLRFEDIMRKHPSFRCALVVDKVHVLLGQSNGRSSFPTSQYRTFLHFGFPLVTLEDVSKLRPFLLGKTSALGVSSHPSGFYTRSMSSRTMRLGLWIVELLKEGPMTNRDIAAKTGEDYWSIWAAARRYSEIVKVSMWYGLNRDEIFQKFLVRGSKSAARRKLVGTWLRDTLLRVLTERNSIEVEDFAGSIGIGSVALSRLLHSLENEGMIRQVGRGRWALVSQPA